MRQMTRLLAGAAALTVAAPVGPTVAAGHAGADTADGQTFMPFNQVLRRCDHSEMDYVGPKAYARTEGVIRYQGSGLSADVQMAAAVPNTRYDVRLIQAPRPSSAPCPGGVPGVVHAVLNTNAAGAGSVVLSDTIQSGTTGAWLFISRPGQFSQEPAEFYTTDLIAPV